jgi:two-component system response regulator AlgR
MIRLTDNHELRILIVDDEAPARARLRALIDGDALGQVVGEADDGMSALTAVCALHPQVVLLDVRMPGLDGLEIAARIATMHQAPAVIFTTAYDQHALAAFDARAVDYLLKPVRARRLAAALQRAEALVASMPDLVEDLGASIEGRTYVGYAQRLVLVEDVILFRAEHKYVSAYYDGGEVLLEESLGALELEFGECFMRVHRNALVGVRYIQEMVKGDAGRWHLQLRGVADSVEVSRRLVSAVRARLCR